MVIGTSAGGVEALQNLVRGLPADLEAAVFVVLHLSLSSAGHLPRILSRAGPLPVASARDEEPIRAGRIFVAPPDLHLCLVNGNMRLDRGARQNAVRPSIDQLFESAAREYGRRVVGVILSGLLDDGSAGLLAVARAGGVTVVQDPDDAIFPEMPMNAIRAVEVDHVLPLAEIPALLTRLARGADEATHHSRPGRRGGGSDVEPR